MCMCVVTGGLGAEQGMQCIGVGRFRILGRQGLDIEGSKGGRIRSRHMTS